MSSKSQRSPEFGNLAAGFLSDVESAALKSALSAGTICPMDMPPGAAGALLILSLQALRPGPWVAVTDGPLTLDALAREVRSLAGESASDLHLFPSVEDRSFPGGARNSRPAGQRLAVLRRAASHAESLLILTCVQALLQPTDAPGTVRYRRIEPGTRISPRELIGQLEQEGYEIVLEVQAPGEAVCRGGLLDVWPPVEEDPIRIEFFGDGVESLRRFDPTDQRSRGCVQAVEFGPARETRGDRIWTLADHLPAAAGWIWMEPARIGEHAEWFERADPPDGHVPWSDFQARVKAGQDRAVIHVASPEAGGGGGMPLDVQPMEQLPSLADLPGGPDAMERLRRDLVERWMNRAGSGTRVCFFFSTEGARERFVEQYAPGRTPAGFEMRSGWLSGGFSVHGGRLTIVAESDLYGVRREPRGERRAGIRRDGIAGAETVTDWSAIRPGDLVVHVAHGIGRYRGLVETETAGKKEEALCVEYADRAKCYAPVSQAHLLSRYVGLGGREPELHRLGGGRWLRERDSAERSARDLAASLLETQALRQARRGHAFDPDPPWYKEFEDGFPFEETPDQRLAIEAVRKDMENARPMDRLICGDVGYGKTEIAMRAAFKAVACGKQVALLVPTTVLAHQHFETFRERLADFPVTLGMLSRFVTPARQREMIERMKSGRLDIVIGTHRLAQPDIAFKDLGLVIIDEEHRFGVEHKEALKRISRTVDVLTLTATPIPRTLYLGLMGTRDLSVIETPPRERLPIETIVVPWDPVTIRNAILSEINREGQVFFLHNRVATIESVRDLLVRLTPEARIVVAHGQMPEAELERALVRFVARQADVLLCTTIIESGVDMPNVNTILIDRADQFGLSELYQLRGRVGRYRRQAYAYLLLPKHGRLFDTARKRIGALRRHTALGSGFRLSLRDLELRGAGNLLGAKQSGHVAAVGFDLYCRLLRRAVSRLKGEDAPPPPDTRVLLDFLSDEPDRLAAIPTDYLDDEDMRLAWYRKIAAISTERERTERMEECRDRYGRRPPALERLFLIARIRLLARDAGIESVESRGDQLIFLSGGAPWMPAGRYPRLTDSHPTRRLQEIEARLLEFMKADLANRPPAVRIALHAHLVGQPSPSLMPSGPRTVTPFRGAGTDILHTE